MTWATVSRSLLSCTYTHVRNRRPVESWCRLGTCKCLPLAFAELRRVNTNQHLSAGWGYGCREDASTHQPQATREYFKNHPTHDCEIDPTIGGHIGRGIGHPWGALGLLCRKATRRYTKEKGYDNNNDSKRQDLAFRTRAEDDEALWLVGGTTLCCLAVPGTERIQVDNLLRDTVGFVRETLQSSAKRI